MNLAIKGHPTRGNEVIEILEMLGGKNTTDIHGGLDNAIYIINSSCYGEIDYIPYRTDAYTVFTIEEFLEKFPYKVGDKVIYENIKREVTKMVWEEHTNTVAYKLDDKLYCNVIKELQPYKEKTMEENIKEKCDLINFNSHYIFDFADKVELILKDDWEVKNEEGKTFVVRKQPPYPKPFENCLKILGYNIGHTIPMNHGHNGLLMMKFQRLLIYRDAYWNIAGDWEEKRKEKVIHYVIYSTLLGEVVKDTMPNCIANYLLDFPTEEMRDAFYDNFKDLIEQCKKLL